MMSRVGALTEAMASRDQPRVERSRSLIFATSRCGCRRDRIKTICRNGVIGERIANDLPVIHACRGRIIDFVLVDWPAQRIGP